jgi:hypothetical protein
MILGNVDPVARRATHADLLEVPHGGAETACIMPFDVVDADMRRWRTG